MVRVGSRIFGKRSYTLALTRLYASRRDDTFGAGRPSRVSLWSALVSDRLGHAIPLGDCAPRPLHLALRGVRSNCWAE